MKAKNIVKIISIAVIIIVLFMAETYASGEKLRFRKSAYLTNLLEINKNTYKENSILIEIPLANKQEHELTYFLDSGYKNKATFDITDDGLLFKYSVISHSGTNVTASLVQNDYLEMDYSKNVPDWSEMSKQVNSDGDLEYLISKSSSNIFTGVAFNIDGTEIIMKWDIGKETVYFQTSNYNAGYIMPITVVNGSGDSETINVIKALENFKVSASHYEVKNGSNVNTNPFLKQDSDMAGSKAGIDISFMQAKSLNMSTWTYEYASNLDDIEAIITINDIADGSNAQFSFKLNEGNDASILNAQNEAENNDAVQYTYSNNKYKVSLVKDKSNLNDKNNFVQWNQMKSSRIYDVKVSLQLPLDNSFDSYKVSDFYPKSSFAFTYLKYDIVRTSEDEGFLKVYPYFLKNEEVEYLVLNSTSISLPLDINEDLWLKSFHKSEDLNDILFIPIKPKSEAFQDNYQLVMKFGGEEVYSQLITYNASQDNDYPVSTPRIKNVDNIIVIPNNDQDPVKAMIDLAFSAPKNKGEFRELDKVFEKLGDDGHLYYELYINDEAKLSSSNPYSMIKVFELSKVDGRYAMSEVTPDGVDKAKAANYYDFIKGYDRRSEQFRMDSIVLSDNAFVKELKYESGNYVYTQDKASIANNSINFLRLKAVTVIDGNRKESEISLPYSVSLSDSATKVPIVDNWSYTPLVEESLGGRVEISIHSIDENLYKKTMLDPVGKNLEKIKYRVYLAKDKSLFNENMQAEELDRSSEGTTSNGTPYIEVSKEDRQKLSSGNILYFDVQDIKFMRFILRNLEQNSLVNARVRTIFELDDGTEVSSVLGSLLEMTVSTDFVDPNQDKEPLSPDNFIVSFNDDSGTAAKLNFFVPKGYDFKNDGVGFEIISVKGAALENASKEKSLENLVQAYSQGVAEGIRLRMINHSLKFERIEKDEVTDIDENLFKKALDEITVVDNKNTPNSLYYYYVRTIAVEGDEIKGRSAFISASITTENIRAPKNLELDNSHTCNKKYEAVIEFDGPVVNVADVPDKYDFEIFIKKEEGDYYKPFVTFIGSKNSSLSSYTKFVYKIKGLESGKTYKVKLRVIDKTNGYDILPDGSSAYPKSAYSNILNIRTQFSQADYDREQKYKQYVDYFKLKSKKILEKPYYTLYETSRFKEVLYKDKSLYSLVDGSSIKLENFDKRSVSVYIPSSYLDEMKKRGLKLELPSYQNSVWISYSSLRNMHEKAEYYLSRGSAKDYFIKLNLYNRELDKDIDGKQVVSYEMDLDPRLYVYRIRMVELEQRIEERFDTVVESRVNYLLDDLEDEIYLLDKVFLNIVLDNIKKLKNIYYNRSEIIFDSNIYGVYSFDYFADKITYVLGAKDTSSLNYMYEKKDSYRKVNADYWGGKFHYDSKNTNKFVLLAKTSGLEDGNAELVSEYGLDEVYNFYEISNGSIVGSKQKFLEAAAKLLGRTWRELVSITGVSSANALSPLKNEEALFVYLKLYEMLNDIDLDRTQIYDYYLIEDIDEVDYRYKNTLLKGLNLGLLKLEDARVYPKSNMNMKKALELLNKLHKGE